MIFILSSESGSLFLVRHHDMTLRRTIFIKVDGLLRWQILDFAERDPLKCTAIYYSYIADSSTQRLCSPLSDNALISVAVN